MLESIDQLIDAFRNTQQQRRPSAALVLALATAAHNVCEVVLHGKATANAAPADRIDGQYWVYCQFLEQKKVSNRI
jgi:hypothetical protein